MTMLHLILEVMLKVGLALIPINQAIAEPLSIQLKEESFLFSRHLFRRVELQRFIPIDRIKDSIALILIHKGRKNILEV